MMDRLPSVLITSNRNELKVYQGNVVYLNNGDNFELRFFNPTKFKIGVEISFNGTKKGNGYLVVNPGQDIILDRFLNEQRKMLFETYNIDSNNKSALEAIEENGIISFNFYKEHSLNWNNSFNYNSDKDVKIKYKFPKKAKNVNLYGSISTFSTTKSPYTYSSTINRIYSQGSTGPAGPVGTPGSQGPSFSDYNTTSSVFYDNITLTNNQFSISNNILETGRIEKGDTSEQNIATVNVQFENTPFHSVTYKILPISTMNMTNKEIRQYCPECRYRLRKQTWKYCPSCGEKI
jgi:hypothetical protein